jgi:hypothetical protein
VSSTRQLQQDVVRERALFVAAAQGLGLTPSEYAEFEDRIADRELTYVVIPRRLDAMSWRTGRQIHVLRDVVIPAGTMGWEVDLAEHSQIVALFIPSKCGNLSLLRKPVPVIAAATPLPAPYVAAPAPLPVPTPAPVATAAPYAEIAAIASTPAPRRRMGAWPFLLIPLIALLASHTHSGPVTIPPITPVSAPTPPPGGCPTPAPSH